MNNTRFDWLARSMSSRRAFNRALAGAVASLPGLRIINDVGAASCPKGEKRCGKKCIPKRGCCTNAQCKPRNSGQVCRRGRCVCPGGMKRCGKRCIPKAAACPPRADASCPPGGLESFGNANQQILQTFREPNGGRLIAAAMFFRNDSATTTGTYELQLQTVDPATGFPQGVTLGLARRSATGISATTIEPVKFTFPTPPRLLPGRQYALALTLVNSTSRWWTHRKAPSDCPGGKLFIPGITGGYVEVSGFVIPYQTFVKP